MFKQRVTRAFHVYYYSTCGSTQKDLVMKVLTAKEVNFVSGGSINGQDDPWNYSSDSGDGSSGSSGSCDVPGSQSTSSCLAPGGFMNTGMPSTSGNSVGDVDYAPPTQEEVCENADQLIKGGAGLLGVAKGLGYVGSPAVVAVGATGGVISGLGAFTSLGNGC
mgnify:CR=1 FL=1|jgi:hypothetical protein